MYVLSSSGRQLADAYTDGSVSIYVNECREGGDIELFITLVSKSLIIHFILVNFNILEILNEF